jgi:recombination protein RecA
VSVVGKLLAAYPDLRERIYSLNEIPPQAYYPSGIRKLDEFLGGGLPAGRIVEWYGPKGIGKTTVALHFQPELYICTERDLYVPWVAKISPNTNVAFPKTAEKALELLEAAVKAKLQVVVLDSLAGMVPEAELTGGKQVGLFPRVVNAGLRRVIVANEVTAVVIINQVRMVLNHPGLLDSPGGEFLKHACSQRVEFRPGGEYVTRGERRIGHSIRLILTKNKVGAPYTWTMLYLTYDGAIHETPASAKNAQV